MIVAKVIFPIGLLLGWCGHHGVVAMRHCSHGILVKWAAVHCWYVKAMHVICVIDLWPPVGQWWQVKDQSVTDPFMKSSSLYEHLRGFVVGLLPWKTPMYVNVGGDGSWQLKFPNWLGKSGWGKEVIFFPFNNSNQDALQKGILNFSLQDRLQFQCLPLDSVSRMWNTWSYSYCCWVKLLSCYLIVTNSVVSNCRYTLLWQTVSLLPLTSVFYLASCFLAATLLGLIFTSGPNRT